LEEEKSVASDSDGEQDMNENVDMDAGAPGSGTDALRAHPSYDIPRVNDIPIVSRLSKKAQEEELDGPQRLEKMMLEKRENINKVMGADDDHLETHFVENPYIKIRERTSQRQRDSKVQIGAQ